MKPSKTQSDRAAQLLMELLALDGPSGGESAVAAYVTAALQEAGVAPEFITTDDAHKRSSLGGALGNLVLKLHGTVKAPRRMLSAHMDTVPVCAGAKPVRKGRRVVAADKKTGLGGDDRAGCAVILATALAIIEEKLPHGPLTFLWTVQEEAGLHGARHLKLSKLGKPAMAFNWDGGAAGKMTLGATGGYRMTVVVEGIASHAGVHPEEGVSAIAAASLAIADLTAGGWHGLIEKKGRRGTSNVGVIHGGAATNVVADRVELKVEARSHDGRFRAEIIKQIERAFIQAAKKTRNVAGATAKVAIDGRLDYESFRLERTEPCVAVAVAAAEAENVPVEYAIANGGLDANWLTAHGIPTVSLGCGQNAIHTTSEWLDLDEFDAACRIARRIATAEKG